MATNYLQCDECGDDTDKYIKFALYDCSQCGKKNRCESCIEWAWDDNNYIQDKKPFCSECYNKKEDIRKCNNCFRVLQCEFSTCYKCDKKNICINCVYHYDNREEGEGEGEDENEKKIYCYDCYMF